MPAADKRAEGEASVLAAINVMSDEDRVIAERIHEIVSANAPNLVPRTWYGMPAYANEAGNVLCFFQTKQRFKTRYATFGFQHDAKLDNGGMWPVAFAVTEITDEVVARITELVKQAVKK